jgi:hypothetical protein
MKSVHGGTKDLHCTHDGCAAVFFQTSHLKAHYQIHHTKEGQQKKVSKQDRLHKLLKEHYIVDTECTIRYQFGCVPDPDKFCARVDFHIVGKCLLVCLHETGHHLTPVSAALPCHDRYS